jgi:hypothetical protein
MEPVTSKPLDQLGKGVDANSALRAQEIGEASGSQRSRDATLLDLARRGETGQMSLVRAGIPGGFGPEGGAQAAAATASAREQLKMGFQTDLGGWNAAPWPASA